MPFPRHQVAKRGVKPLKPFKYFQKEPRYLQRPDADKTAAAGFNVGRKPIFLPFFVLTFMRTPHLPPTFAKFKVPLKLNKFDMRDYLFHAYGVRSVGVRSYIRQSKLKPRNPEASEAAPQAWFRPMSTKYMFVELERPFVWPKEPEDYEEFDKKTWDLFHKQEDRDDNKVRRDASMEKPEDAAVLREQAKALLSGKTKWAPTRSLDPRSVSGLRPDNLGPGLPPRRGRGGLNKARTGQVETETVSRP